MLSLELVVCAVLILTVSAVAQVPPGKAELVVNPNFSAGPDSQTPANWTIWKPGWDQAACPGRVTEGGLLFQAPGRPYAVGGASQALQGIQGGQAYAVEVRCELRDIIAPYQSVIVRLTWKNDGKLVHPAGMLVRGPFMEGTQATFKDVLVSPPEANGAELSLEVKWPQGGSVLWKSASVTPTSSPSPRKVKVGTVYLRPQKSTPEKNMQLWCEQIDAAGKLGLDIVCLGETILSVGTQATGRDVAKPIPGPDTEALGEAARRNHIWVVAGLMERDGETLYNTAVLLDREGKLAGKYRKIHLPREEWKQGTTPGTEYPVFRTDFGTIAIQICYDWFFPEPEAIFAMKGAEIIFAPTWGNTLPDQEGRVDGETTFRVRARDNGVYMVPSVYDGSSMVIDPLGRILVSNEGKTGVFWAEVDLSLRDSLWWVGYWRSIGPRDRMPATYDALLSWPPQPNY